MRVLRIQDTCSKIAISRTSLWRLCKQDDFPQPISIGGGRVIGFLEHEIDHWLEARAAARKTTQGRI
ncbi:helix-turn-helix transcriptional regulator [Pseudomonas petrae]|uniref:helix-turn-helix transcriptional regulator n=1 Tax=Pseudomonas petrae TaxID=2912190 RepID=UPI001F239B30|nr:AlpA family phage regulatory protein [Pseudomonas petrae]MCF7539814.1 AlpA family phage regulatory protein [Pseudomonas petrae]